MKNRTALRVLDSKTPYELLHEKRLNIANIPCWGTRVWVHDLNASKLNTRVHEGRWVGFDAESGGHRVYLEDHRMVAVERNVSFARHERLVLGLPCLQIEGEKRKGSDSNQRADLEDSATTSAPKPPPPPTVTTKPDAAPDNPNMSSSTTIDPLGSNFEAPAPTLRRLTRQRTELPYLRMLRNHKGTHDSREGEPIFPRGVQSADV
ncbi:hypothetical protein PAXRUDRAFT_768874 [Paxillus rubicundulus Ve08.2h10]|uniref:Retroviral polymerase SH3-like domain-containing protein n=1 Tax=Paxillus rubicundulus Ve08.2h10 TaxID=930991 RepID=A0A0D0DMF6_9AGAM|nr:hypothetical protein PAXRUDRAFT_768874 [Paxillus rubicundulus Ve08.2h10]